MFFKMSFQIVITRRNIGCLCGGWVVAFLELMDGGTWCFLAGRFYDALSDMLLRQAPSDAYRLSTL
jgi:hypothetical protein